MQPCGIDVRIRPDTYRESKISLGATTANPILRDPDPSFEFDCFRHEVEALVNDVADCRKEDQ